MEIVEHMAHERMPGRGGWTRAGEDEMRAARLLLGAVHDEASALRLCQSLKASL